MGKYCRKRLGIFAAFVIIKRRNFYSKDVRFKSRKQNGKNIFFIALSQNEKAPLVGAFSFCSQSAGLWHRMSGFLLILPVVVIPRFLGAFFDALEEPVLVDIGIKEVLEVYFTLGALVGYFGIVGGIS